MDGHQGAGLGFRTTAAGALVADPDDIVLQVFDHQTAAVRRQQGPDIFIHVGVDDIRLDGVAEAVEVFKIDFVEDGFLLFVRFLRIVVVDQRLLDGLDDRVDQQFPFLGRDESDRHEPVLNQEGGDHAEAEHRLGEWIAFRFDVIVVCLHALGDDPAVEVEFERRRIWGRLRGHHHEFTSLSFHQFSLGVEIMSHLFREAPWGGRPGFEAFPCLDAGGGERDSNPPALGVAGIGFYRKTCYISEGQRNAGRARPGAKFYFPCPVGTDRE